MLKHRVRLTSLSFSVWLEDVPVVLRILEHCGTQQLSIVSAHIKNIAECTTPDTPTGAKEWKQQKSLHDAIATRWLFRCILERFRLQSALLNTSLDFEPYFHGVNIETRAFSILTKGLTRLQALVITRCEAPSFFPGLLRFLIKSESLKSLDISSLPEGQRCFITCKCPNLEEYRCTADAGSGVIPRLSGKEALTRLGEGLSDDGGFVSRSSFDFPYMEVPDFCRITINRLSRFNYWKVYDGVYDLMMDGTDPTWPTDWEVMEDNQGEDIDQDRMSEDDETGQLLIE